jgi:hypothetical protein
MGKAVIKSITLTSVEIGERRLVQRAVEGGLAWHIQFLYSVLDGNGNIYKQGELVLPIHPKYQELFAAQIKAADDALRFAEGLFDEKVDPADPADIIKIKPVDDTGIIGKERLK